MRALKSVWTAVVVTALTATAVIVSPAPSYATSKYRCNYPYVCIYGGLDWNTAPIVGRYQDLSSGYQYQSGNRTNFAVWNTRNDDVVYILYRKSGENFDRVWCITPNYGASWIEGQSFRGIRIDSSQYCSLS
jgi:hypothetical protein